MTKISPRHYCSKHVDQVSSLLSDICLKPSVGGFFLEEQRHVYSFCLQCVQGRETKAVSTPTAFVYLNYI